MFYDYKEFSCEEFVQQSQLISGIKMFMISVEDTGNHSATVLSEIKRCLQQSFKAAPENLDQTRDSIAEKLARPNIMGGLYRYLWVDQMGRNYFIIIATCLEDGMGRGKPILAWSVRRKPKRSLAERCVEVISENLTEKQHIELLGLPTRLEREVEEIFLKMAL